MCLKYLSHPPTPQYSWANELPPQTYVFGCEMQILFSHLNLKKHENRGSEEICKLPKFKGLRGAWLGLEPGSSTLPHFIRCFAKPFPSLMHNLIHLALSAYYVQCQGHSLYPQMLRVLETDGYCTLWRRKAQQEVKH